MWTNVSSMQRPIHIDQSNSPTIFVWKYLRLTKQHLFDTRNLFLIKRVKLLYRLIIVCISSTWEGGQRRDYTLMWLYFHRCQCSDVHSHIVGQAWKFGLTEPKCGPGDLSPTTKVKLHNTGICKWLNHTSLNALKTTLNFEQTSPTFEHFSLDLEHTSTCYTLTQVDFNTPHPAHPHQSEFEQLLPNF